MHGMLSAAVMLAAFAVIALVGGVSAVWLFRAAAAAPRRSRSARLTGMPGAATDPAPGVPGVPGVPEDEETAGPEPEYPERSWPGAVPAASVQLAGPSRAGYDGPAGPDDPAPPPGADDVYDHLGDWPDAEGSRDGHGGHGPNSPGRRGWPDTTRSLYSRGWPAMESSAPAPGPEQARNGTETGAAQEHDGTAEEGPPERPEGARVYVLGESRRPGR